MFEPVFSKESELPEAGKRLGLALAREIAEKHGGGIQVRPDGVCPAVEVYLPGAKADLEVRALA